VGSGALILAAVAVGGIVLVDALVDLHLCPDNGEEGPVDIGRCILLVATTERHRNYPGQLLLRSSPISARRSTGGSLLAVYLVRCLAFRRYCPGGGELEIRFSLLGSCHLLLATPLYAQYTILRCIFLKKRTSSKAAVTCPSAILTCQIMVDLAICSLG
jgi:hypothetical protein